MLQTCREVLPQEGTSWLWLRIADDLTRSSAVRSWDVRCANGFSQIFQIGVVGGRLHSVEVGARPICLGQYPRNMICLPARPYSPCSRIISPPFWDFGPTLPAMPQLRIGPCLSPSQTRLNELPSSDSYSFSDPFALALRLVVKPKRRYSDKSELP